jgi:hypothetical protein
LKKDIKPLGISPVFQCSYIPISFEIKIIQPGSPRLGS